MMWACDVIEDLIHLVQQLPVDQLAVYAVVTIVTASIVYLLVDALRYKAIPELNVAPTPGSLGAAELAAQIVLSWR